MENGGRLEVVRHADDLAAFGRALAGLGYIQRDALAGAAFGGIARVAPIFATVFMITALASIGVPGTSGFVGEFLALLGAFETHPIITIIAASGVIFAAYYMLPMVQKIFFNKLEKPENREIKDLNGREIAIMAPLCALMLIIGWHPTPILERMEPSVRVVLERVEAAAPATSQIVELGTSATAELDTDDPDEDAEASAVVED